VILPFQLTTEVGQVGQVGCQARRPVLFVVELSMAKDAETEKTRDLARIETALDKIESVMAARAPSQAHPSFVQALETAQLKAIDRIVPLLARKAAMLGYDSAKNGGDNDRPSGTLAELERKLALVGPGKAS